MTGAILLDRKLTVVVVVCTFIIACLALPVVADPTFSSGVSQGTVPAPINEDSGLVASRNCDGVLWVHNDSGDVARVFAIDTQGQLLGTYNIMESGTTTYAPATDFEDIAIGPGPETGVTYLFVGDIGDNSSQRANIRVYRIAEPVAYTRQSASPVTKNLNQGEWTSITLEYPDGAHNAEGMFVEPSSGDLYIATKQSGTIGIYQATRAQLESGTTVTMSLVRTMSLSPGELVTAAHISPTGGEILLKGYGWNRLWQRDTGQSIDDALGGTPIDIPLVSEVQGEAITFDGIGNDYYTHSENGSGGSGPPQALYLYERTSDDGPMPPTVPVASESDWKYLDDGSDQGTAWRAPGFDDGAWPNGPAQLGYGDGDEQTVVSYGGDSNDKHVTTYFRTTFDANDVDAIDALTVRVVYDDGVAVYLNGTEIVRANLDANAAFDDLATGTQYALENTWFEVSVDPNLLVEGTNTLAAEVHQVGASSSDISFDLQLLASLAEPTAVLLLTETNGVWGDVDLDPEPDDPNEMAFPEGAEVTLTASPVDGKSLRHWQIFDPNFPNDANHATLDANEVITIVMDTDMHVNAVWKCGSGSAPLLPLALGVLVLAAVARRRGRK